MGDSTPPEVPVSFSSPMTSGPRVSKSAVWSLVSGVVGIFTCFLIVAPVAAVVLGIKALRDIRSEPERLAGRGVAAIGVVLGVVGLYLGGSIIASALDSPDRTGSDTADVVPADAYGVGTCTDAPGERRLADLREMACDRAHGGEIVHRGPAQEGLDRYPGREAMIEMADRRCDEGFEDYVGVSVDASPLRVYAFPPDRARWDDGRRDVVCVAANPSGTLPVGSVVGTGG
jgi:hypothetical protein